jgi:oligopeptidase B
VATWKKDTEPKGLIMIGYGAYGLATPFETTRWRPYIESGFAVAFALIRGGGDDTEVWAQKGRLQGKLQGIEDFEACIRAVQRITRVPPKATCIFGRSAGGFLVGATVVRNPAGDLFSTVYTEVPYVDVLQTAANGDLPLTKFEYNEFGDPAHKIADFEFLLRLSPVSGLGAEGAPNIFVACRVGLNDRQVFPYESVKWMDALRGLDRGQPKLLYFTDGYGHTVHGDEVYTQRAEDFLILNKKLLG